jgi:hypothetical protein
MCSRSLMCGVSDYRVFTNICHGNNDHHLLAVTLQLRLRVPPRPGASRGVWDAAVLWDRPQATADFCSLLRNRFALLSPALLDPEAEWSALERELSEVAGHVVGKARPARRHKPGLTQATLALVARKHQAHRVVLARPQCVEACSVFRVANTKVKRVVASDADAFAQKQAKVAKNLQRASCPRQWAQQVRSMVGVAPGRGAPGCILNSAGVSLHTPHAILDRFGGHFVGVLGGGVDISPTTRDFLKYCVHEVESSLGAGGRPAMLPSPPCRRWLTVSLRCGMQQLLRLSASPPHF